MRIQPCSRPSNLMFAGGGRDTIGGGRPSNLMFTGGGGSMTGVGRSQEAAKRPEPGPDHAKATSAKEYRWPHFIPMLLHTLCNRG